MVGTKLCTRRVCKQWKAVGSGATSTAPNFSCEKESAQCVDEPDKNLEAPKSETTPGCVFTETTCSCSFSKTEPSSICMRATSSSIPHMCSIGPCEDGFKWYVLKILVAVFVLAIAPFLYRNGFSKWGTRFKPMKSSVLFWQNRISSLNIRHLLSDCLSPTHICRRDATCTRWTPTSKSAVNPDTTFECMKTPGVCTVVQEMAPSVTRQIAPETPQKATVGNSGTSTILKATVEPSIEKITPFSECSLKCPKCYVPNNGCLACIPDTSLSPEESSECDPCDALKTDICISVFGLPEGLKW